MRSAFMLVLFLCIILNAMAASANPIPMGVLCVYGEPQGSQNCNIDEVSLVVLYFYYFDQAEGATTIEFRCDISETVNWIHNVDSCPFPSKIGNFHDGTKITFYDCLTGIIYLGSASYCTTGDTPPCSYIYLRNHPIPSIPDHYGLPVFADCESPEEYWWADTKESVINPTPECSCICCPVSTEEASWGHIKALLK